MTFLKLLFFIAFASLTIFRQDLTALEMPKKKMHEITVCAIFQNEAPYLKEWIEFHRLMGVERFYLYNNLSTDNYKEVLKPYIESKIVSLKEWPYAISEERPWYTIQCDAYNHALKAKGYFSKWMAFIDVDEFLMPVQKNNLVDALKEFENYGGVGVNWQLYGTSDVEKVPDNALLVESLLYKAEENFSSNRHVKSIVCPRRVEHFQNAHFAIYKEGFFHVDENKKPFSEASTSQVSVKKLRINHYWTRDLDYFHNVKLASRQKRGWSVKADIDTANKLNSLLDPAIMRFVPALRKNMDFEEGKD